MKKNDPQIRKWIQENPKIENWIAWNDPEWCAWFEEKRKDPEWLAYFDARRKEPEYSKWQSELKKRRKEAVSLLKEAEMQLDAQSMTPVVERWKQLQAEKEALGKQALAIVKRLDELESIAKSQSISAELNAIDQTLTAGDARLNAIEEEIAPLNRQLDEFAARHPKMGKEEKEKNEKTM